ncbi:MAG: hypothetical protein HQL68_10800 [Magnetococcales bacterium]|nr:hypothetical protein [Magnetococcales bacterium]
MPEIIEGTPILWRERDLIYSNDSKLDEYLKKTGATKISRQGFCYNEDIFNNKHESRGKKVIIIASSYIGSIHDTPQIKKLVAELIAHFESGEAMTDEILDRFSKSSGFNKETIFYDFWHFVVREISVQWLCELADNIEVEVYGRYWEKNSVVKPFFKGEIPHGPKVAKLYNSALYTLVPHPFDLGSQRLAEASSCGSIPIVYDCRQPSQNIPWENSCLWYRTKEDLRSCISKLPTKPVEQICEGKSYSSFARRILDEIDKAIANQ